MNFLQFWKVGVHSFCDGSKCFLVKDLIEKIKNADGATFLL